MPINYVFQCLPTLILQKLEGYAMRAWGNIISSPSEISEGTARPLEHRELLEVLVRIMIIHLLCPAVSFQARFYVGLWNFSLTVVQSFLRVTEAFYKCLQLGHVAKRGER